MLFKLRKVAVIGAAISAALMLGAPNVAHATKASPRKTATNAFACTYAGTKGVDETLVGIGKIATTSLREQGWSGKVARWLPGTVNRTYVVGLAPMSPVPTKASCPKPVTAPPPVVPPSGTSDYSASSCRILFIDYPLDQTPVNAPFEYFVDGRGLGENHIGNVESLGLGTFTLTLKVAGEQVDSDQFTIWPCPWDYAGKADYDASSTLYLFVDYPLGRAPANAPFEYIIDGDLMDRSSEQGRHLGENYIGNVESLGTAEHTLALWVGDELVDVHTFQLGVG